MATPTSENGINAVPQRRPYIGRPKDVEALGSKPLAGSTGVDSINSGMNVGSQVNVGPIKPVDRRTVEGSTPGDHRTNGAPVDMSFAFNPPGPRQFPLQRPISGHSPSAPSAPVASTEADEVGD